MPFPCALSSIETFVTLSNVIFFFVFACRPESCKIFAGGLAQDVSENDLRDYFGAYGTVKDAIVMVDRNTGSSRGFGFITFEREDAVDRVLKDDHEIKGKRIEIKKAEPREAG